MKLTAMSVKDNFEAMLETRGVSKEFYRYDILYTRTDVASFFANECKSCSVPNRQWYKSNKYNDD